MGGDIKMVLNWPEKASYLRVTFGMSQNDRGQTTWVTNEPIHCAEPCQAGNGSVSGHGFSRADSAPQKREGFSPCAAFFMHRAWIKTDASVRASSGLQTRAGSCP